MTTTPRCTRTTVALQETLDAWEDVFEVVEPADHDNDNAWSLKGSKHRSNNKAKRHGKRQTRTESHLGTTP